MLPLVLRLKGSPRVPSFCRNDGKTERDNQPIYSRSRELASLQDEVARFWEGNMKVRCVENVVKNLSLEGRRAASEYIRLDEVWLVKGAVYEVYGVFVRRGQPWFLVCEDEDDEYPKPHFCEFFEVIDRAISPNWTLHEESGEWSVVSSSWLKFPDFYERLLDGDAACVALFQEEKRNARPGFA